VTIFDDFENVLEKSAIGEPHSLRWANERYLITFAPGNQVCCITMHSRLLCDDTEWPILSYNVLSEIIAAIREIRGRRLFTVFNVTQAFTVYKYAIL
jgi:hypothetical protein